MTPPPTPEEEEPPPPPVAARPEKTKSIVSSLSLPQSRIAVRIGQKHAPALENV